MNDLRKLLAWQLAHEFVLETYALCAGFPWEERFVLTAQIKKSAISIPSNIAEGVGRFSDPEFRRHVEFATGSAKELEYQLLLAHDLGYLKRKALDGAFEKLNRLQRVLRGLHKALARS